MARKYNIYSFISANKQYRPYAEIMVAHTSLSNAIDLAESYAECALKFNRVIGEIDLPNPSVIYNTFKGVIYF